MINDILVDDILEIILLQTKNCNICYICKKWYLLCHQKIINCLCNVYKHINQNVKTIHCLYCAYKYFNPTELTIPNFVLHYNSMIGYIKYDNNDFIWQTPPFQILEQWFDINGPIRYYGNVSRVLFDFPLDNQIGCCELKQFFDEIDKKTKILWNNQNDKNMYESIVYKQLNQTLYWTATLEFNILNREISTPILIRDPDIKENPKLIRLKDLQHLDDLMPIGSTIRLIIHTTQINSNEYENRNRLIFKIKMIECTPKK